MGLLLHRLRAIGFNLPPALTAENESGPEVVVGRVLGLARVVHRGNERWVALPELGAEDARIRIGEIAVAGGEELVVPTLGCVALRLRLLAALGLLSLL